jgi:hypothetical protein
MEYTVDYFIEKFSAIPDDEWYVGDYANLEETRRCARGHCGKRIFVESPEDNALVNLFEYNVNVIGYVVSNINDGKDIRYNQPTAKERIVAALWDIKKDQSPQISNPPVFIEDIIGVKKLAETH